MDVMSAPRFFGVQVVPTVDRLTSGSPRNTSVAGKRVLSAFFNHLVVDAGSMPFGPLRVSPNAIEQAYDPGEQLYVVQLHAPEAAPEMTGWVLDPRTLSDTGAVYNQPRGAVHYGVHAMSDVLNGTPLATAHSARSGGTIFNSGPKQITANRLTAKLVASEVFVDNTPPRNAEEFVDDVGHLTALVLAATTGGSPDFPAQTCEVVAMDAGKFMRLARAVHPL